MTDERDPVEVLVDELRDDLAELGDWWPVGTPEYRLIEAVRDAVAKWDEEVVGA